MAIETPEGGRRAGRYVLLALAAVAGLAGAVVLYVRLSRPPQMGADEEVFRTVDALYTAVRGRDAARLEQCAARLEEHRRAGKLPKDAAAHLDGIVRRARAGRWQAASERLYAFMLAQRREGAG
jgi:hypothetical protein